MIAFVSDDEDFKTHGESRMMPILVEYLESRRWIRSDSILLRELPINGRRVDLATLTKSGVLSAYELKTDDFARVLEQSVYNRYTFDKSWIVIGSNPRDSSLDEAKRFGIGVISIVDGRVRLLCLPGPSARDPKARQRAISKFRMGAKFNVR